MDAIKPNLNRRYPRQNHHTPRGARRTRHRQLARRPDKKSESPTVPTGTPRGQPGHPHSPHDQNMRPDQQFCWPSPNGLMVPPPFNGYAYNPYAAGAAAVQNAYWSQMAAYQQYVSPPSPASPN